MATTDLPVTGSVVVLSASYQDASGWVQAANSGWVTFVLAWTQGDETSIEAAVDISNGATARLPSESVAAGVITSTPASWTFAKAAWTSLNPVVAVRVGVGRARILVKATGGTPTGSVTVTQQEASNA